MTADTVGGVWTFAVDLCRGLDRLGVDVALATMGALPTGAQRAEVAACRRLTLHESTFRLEWMAEPWADVAAAGQWLLDVERAFAPDVVHLNGYAHGALPWAAPVLVTGHSCVLSWWRAVHGRDAPAGWDGYREAVTRGIRAADRVVAPTAAMLASLQEHYGPLPPAALIPNGRNTDTQRLGARDAYRHRPPAVLRRPLVLAAGRVWDEAKNFAVLGEAARLVRWPVFVAGTDTAPDGTSRTVPGVHQLGWLAAGALREWYRRASVFVHPSLYEPFGLAPLEAALSGCALVLADIPSLREVWADAATYADPRDASAIARAVNTLAEQPHLLAERATAAHHRARALTARAMVRRYHETYLELAGARVAPMAGAGACAS